MRFLTYVWTTVTTVTHWFISSPLDEAGVYQKPLGNQPHLSVELNNVKPSPPLFEPPGSNIEGFKCDYSNMGSDWVDCSTSIPGCWLMNEKTGQTYNVTTDYESDAPMGITRNYTLYVTEGTSINADGINFLDAKVFNGQFPGPLLEACWGDRVNVTVVNQLKTNGTSIHWHGIRQNQTMHMDGVNGITQCPIAPGDSFTYIWNAMQYGSSWYHSHYSVQYADGLQGPITIHGPTTVAYDEAIIPLLTSDWLHNSAFNAIYTGNEDYPTILLNGTGNCLRFSGVQPDPGLSIPPGFEMVFNRTAPNPKTGARRYLLRVINTSFSTQITFSIDNHYLLIVEADFVPVEPQNVTSVLVAIGQRYHIIVEAQPYGGPANPIPKLDNYWIRTNTSGCFDDINGLIDGFERTGILRYDASSDADPTSQTWPDIPTDCLDSLSTQLQTAYNWTVTAPKNGLAGETFQANFQNQPLQYATANFAFQQPDTDFIPFQTTYGNPTFLNLDNNVDAWPVGWVVVPENFTSEDFVYLVLEGGGHPIHLHGHDFAVLDYKANANFSPATLKPPYQSPMRRDVVLLPSNGYVVIAFKTDNPGAWLMHCHIAFHASGGLSLQIMERQADANVIWPPGNSTALAVAQRGCAKWNSWAYDCRNVWPGNVNGQYPACENATELQNDSGV